jgi:hypothetical protein
MWTVRTRAVAAVDKSFLSPARSHRLIRLSKRLRGLFPVVHTLYDYDKGIS